VLHYQNRTIVVMTLRNILRLLSY